MNYAQTLKDLLDGWWGTFGFALGIIAIVTYFYVPNSCEKPVCGESCPWNRNTKQRRRYWTWRVRRAQLYVLWDAVILIWAAGRVTTDIVLSEVAWTLPIIAIFGAWVAREWVRDARYLGTTRAKLHELTER